MRPTVLLLVLIIIVCATIGLSKSEYSSTYTKIYSLGGAPSIVPYDQQHCPNFSFSGDHQSLKSNNTISCHTATLRGMRYCQEDRLFCDMNIQIPFFGENGVKEVSVGMAAVFDGHRGAEASEMASRLVLDYFLLHSRYIQYEIKETLGVGLDESMHMGILKEALLRTIRDIDITFTKEASRNGLVSGCTAAVVLVADNQILVANVGDSKVLLCSHKFHSPPSVRGALLEYRRNNIGGVIVRDHKNIGLSNNNGLTLLHGRELTRDHHPDREDEKRRIEAAGGYVVSGLHGGIPRVNGGLAVSRSIGDLDYKIFGVTAVPEVSDWQPLTRNDSYLVISSDGIFESLNAQDVCQLLPELPTSDHTNNKGLRLFEPCESPVAECILRTAYEKGSRDNLSVIVIPLRAGGFLS